MACKTSGSTDKTAIPAAVAAMLLLLAGCASPGVPRAPSLQIPTLATGLTAERTGDAVNLTLPPPQRSTDRVPLRGGRYRGVLCRAVDAGPCTALTPFEVAVTAQPAEPARQGRRTASSGPALALRDVLPPDLAAGPPRLLTYRVELFSPVGNSAGRGAPVFALAGTSPPPVSGLQAEGSRAGAVLTWATPSAPHSAAAVLIARESLAPAPTRPGKSAPATLWFNANSNGAATLDTGLTPNTPYRYRAVRVIRATLDGHPLEARSEPSAPADLTLAQTYPPASPSGLTAATVEPTPASTPATPYAVDLIWQPIDDPGPATRTAPPLAGYLIYRQDAAGTAPRRRLTAAPVATPAFHDATAQPAQTYRYSVTAIDTAGNESAPATVTLVPQQ